MCKKKAVVNLKVYQEGLSLPFIAVLILAVLNVVIFLYSLGEMSLISTYGVFRWIAILVGLLISLFVGWNIVSKGGDLKDTAIGGVLYSLFGIVLRIASGFVVATQAAYFLPYSPGFSLSAILPIDFGFTELGVALSIVYMFVGNIILAVIGGYVKQSIENIKQ